MENSTPTNMGKLVANHQIKFIHGRSHAELEVDVNKWLTASLGKYEIKEIKLDFSQSGAWLAMIHYYAHVRVDGVSAIKADRKNTPAVLPTGTRHVAPMENTPMSHNTKQQYSNPMATKPSTVNVPPTAPTAQELNQVNNELDKMKPETKPSRPATVMDRPLENRPTIAELVAPETEDTRGDLSQEEIDGEY